MLTFSTLGNIPIAGRLGNSLHQIASVIGIARRNGLDFAFPQFEWRGWFFNPLPTLYQNTDSFIKISYDGTQYKPFDLARPYNYDLWGYFQSEKYFKPYREEIRYYFTPNFEVNDLAKDFVAIHVRRGDFLRDVDPHTILTMDYYKKAMELYPNENFMVFSDDIDWCKENFDTNKCTFVQETYGPLMDLIYMTTCKAFVISNSSYSWWGAYLGSLLYKTEKRVVAPKNWYRTLNSDDVCPPEWELI
jgi:hypothetical protein